MIDVNAYLGHFAFRQLRYNTAPTLAAYMDRFQIGRAIVSSAAAITYRNPQAGNEELAAEIESHRARFIPFAVLSPVYAGWEDDLNICAQLFGMRGLRLYPRWHNYKLTDPRCRDMVNAAAARGMVISIPCRVEDRRQQGWLVDIPDLPFDEIAGLVRSCPKARFLIQNASGVAGSGLARKGSAVPDNYAVDISRLSAEFGNEIGQLLSILGEDRILFGTGMPFHYPGPAFAKLEMLRVSDSVKEKIRSKNAEAWLASAQRP